MSILIKHEGSMFLSSDMFLGSDIFLGSDMFIYRLCSYIEYVHTSSMFIC